MVGILNLDVIAASFENVSVAPVSIDELGRSDAGDSM
jgi:hypothetical protein